MKIQSKKFTVLFLTVLMVFMTAFPVFASEEEAAPAYHHVIDVAGTIKDKSKAKVENASQSVYEQNGIDLFSYYTEETLDNAAGTAEEIYTSRAYTDAAVVLMFDANKIHIYTFGRANNIFSDEELQDIMSQANAEESYTASFLKYISLCGNLLNEKGVQPIPSERLQPRFVDNAGLVSASDETALLEKLDTISEKQQIDIVIVTENSIGDKTSTQYADDFYDYNGYGFGQSRDGILLLISMENRDWAISTTGQGITIFTDAGQEYMTDQFVSYLSDGDYYGGFNCFADLCDEFIEHYQESGKAYDSGHMPKEPFGIPGALVVSLIGGLGVGLATVSVFKSQLNSVKVQPSAVGYTKPGSLNITERNDLFLYHVVNRTARPRDEGSSSGGGGGSSSHSSSSGSSHGGSSGHF